MEDALALAENVVDAEAYEMWMQEEAKAYAEARVRSERPVGFSATSDTEV
jgi:hypothetical protein